MAKTLSPFLQKLAEQIALKEGGGVFREKTAEKFFAFSLLRESCGENLPKGILLELSGSSGNGKTEVLLKFLAENPEVRVAWVEEGLTVYPCAFPQSQVSLDRVLFVDVPPAADKDAIWVAHQTLRSGIFEVAVLQTPKWMDETALRRLQLTAEKAGASVVLLRDAPRRSGLWPIAVQIEVNRELDFEEGRPQVRVLKYGGRRSLQPVLLRGAEA